MKIGIQVKKVPFYSVVKSVFRYLHFSVQDTSSKSVSWHWALDFAQLWKIISSFKYKISSQTFFCCGPCLKVKQEQNVNKCFRKLPRIWSPLSGLIEFLTQKWKYTNYLCAAFFLTVLATICFLVLFMGPLGSFARRVQSALARYFARSAARKNSV